MANNPKQIKMCLAGERIKGFSDEEFAHEFSVAHAAITKASAEKTPPLLGYRQILAIPKPKISLFGTDKSTWDSQAILLWSSIDDLSSTLKSEGYRANAGKHIFTEPPSLASICQVAGESTFDSATANSIIEQDSSYMMFVYIPRADKTHKSSRDPALTDQEVAQRVEAISKIGAGTDLLRYVINRDVGPSDPHEVFQGTPFISCEWGVMGVTEQYWFKHEEAATSFFADEAGTELLGQLPSSLDGTGCVGIAGRETVLVDKL
ncbi:hypothetical protein QBC37DRAFT_420324 [Rhypophila decipiens]|uniref:EthD domain-containing protein n=1 Tax=Rhypophila decipiens TaxID=261697 RepID=A0AAN7B8Z4_9PEZI|nr:hypothetical protein QBC37DRAFT_420324 [Rhypophila decipiens]